VVVADAELDGPRLRREVTTLLRDEGRLGEMAGAALEVSRPDAADRIADALLRLAAAP
jgi:UDP-N-acetylglucosamine:LPS N-acetylglucosamine transferase